MAQNLPPLPSPERLQELMFDAARMGRDDVVPALLAAGVDIEARDGRGYSALVLASYNGRESTTRLLLAEGALPDGPGDASGNSALMGVAFKGYAANARVLIEGGAQVNYHNGAGQTALMMAALFNQAETIDLLLAAGADPLATDAAGNSPAALARQQGNIALAERLEALAPSL